MAAASASCAAGRRISSANSSTVATIIFWSSSGGEVEIVTAAGPQPGRRLARPLHLLELPGGRAAVENTCLTPYFKPRLSGSRRW